MVERSVLMSDGDVLLPCHLPPDIAAAPRAGDFDEDSSTLRGQERALILKTLESCKWNQCETARALGTTRYHVRHRMKKYGIKRPVHVL